MTEYAACNVQKFFFALYKNICTIIMIFAKAGQKEGKCTSTKIVDTIATDVAASSTQRQELRTADRLSHL